MDTLLRNPKAVLPESSHHDETLFSANSQFGRVTGNRLRRKGEKKQIVEEVDQDIKAGSGLRNSHGGPVAAKMEKKKELNCSETVGSHPEDLAILNTEFSACSDQVYEETILIFLKTPFPYRLIVADLMWRINQLWKSTGSASTIGAAGCHHSMKIISSLCRRFPETRKLNLGQTLSSGHGSVSFDSDQDCTDFVHSFFPDCKPYLSSCSQVGELLRIMIFLLFRWRRTKNRRCSSLDAFLATTLPSWLPCCQKIRIITQCNDHADPSLDVTNVL